MQKYQASRLVKFAPDKLQKTNLFSTERFFLDVYGLEPGQSQKPHAHEGSDKVYVVLEGRGRFRIGPDEETLEQGWAVMAPSGLEHAVTNEGPGRLSLLVFMAPRP